MASGLTFMSLIHFEFIFAHGIRECSDFILFYVAVQFSQNDLLESVFSPLCILVSFALD